MDAAVECACVCVCVCVFHVFTRLLVVAADFRNHHAHLPLLDINRVRVQNIDYLAVFQFGGV